MHAVFIDSNHMSLMLIFRVIPAKLPFSFLFASHIPLAILGDVAFFLYHFCLDLMCLNIISYCIALYSSFNICL